MITHEGVGAIVTNAARTRFFVQQKDADYPRYPLGYSFFGGGVEAGEGRRDALRRELQEELGPAAELLQVTGEPLLCATLEPPGVSYALFEVEVDDEILDRLAGVPVFEGERGAVVDRFELGALPFIWGLGAVVEAYLDGIA